MKTAAAINPTHTANLSNAILTPAVASYPIGVINPTAAFLPSIDPRLTQVIVMTRHPIYAILIMPPIIIDLMSCSRTISGCDSSFFLHGLTFSFIMQVGVTVYPQRPGEMECDVRSII